MNVNFNNLRKQALNSYDSLAKKLNESKLKQRTFVPDEDKSGNILLDANDIQKDMDNLRMLIGSIAMVYEPGDENFKDVFEEVYPNDEDSMVCFNSENEG